MIDKTGFTAIVGQIFLDLADVPAERVSGEGLAESAVGWDPDED